MSIEDIKFYRTEVAGRKPAVANIKEGEIALNLTDKIIFSKNSKGELVEFDGSGIDNSGSEGGVAITILNLHTGTGYPGGTVVELPTGYKWTDFERVEIYPCSVNSSGDTVIETVIVPKELIASKPTSWLCYSHMSGSHYAGIQATSLTSGTLVTASNGRVRCIKAFTKATPVPKDPTGKTVLFASDGVSSGTINLSANWNDFDLLLIHMGDPGNTKLSENRIIDTSGIVTGQSYQLALGASERDLYVSFSGKNLTIVSNWGNKTTIKRVVGINTHYHKYVEPVNDAGVLALLSSFKTTGTWTVTDVVPNKPIFVTVAGSGTGDAGAALRASAGTLFNGGSRDYALGQISSTSSGNNASQIFIPTTTTVQFLVSRCDSNVTLQAWQ